MDSLAPKYKSYKKDDYLIFGGHFDVYKGLYDLPQILKYLARDSNTQRKVIITWIRRRKVRKVARKIKEFYPHAEFLGFIESKQELYRLYSGAKALIYPSHMDGYSLTILDSLGTATPVVAYGIPELVYLYRNVRPVRLVREFDFQTFARELARLAEMDDTKELFDDEKTQEFIRLHSSWDGVAEQYARILLRSLELK